MLTFLIAAIVLASVIGMVGIIGIGGATMELGKLLFFCAVVLVLISAIVGVARGKTRA